ncbi:MAG: hypothetical protein AB7G87_05725 [Clostridia bacterium]
MKQILCWLLVGTFMFSMLVGCASGKPAASQKSEEQIRAELKAEMEAEEKKKEELKEELKAELEAELKKKEEAKEEEQEEQVIGPVNMAIKNYKGEGLERLSKVKAQYKDDNSPYFSKNVLETLAIFGEVTNVKIGYIRMYTEGNYYLLQEFDSLKDTELTIPRSKSDDALITVSFYDKGLKEHIFAFTVVKDHFMSDKTPDKQELVASLDEKYKASTAYKDRSDLVLKSLGLSEKAFESSSIFNNFTEQYDDFDGSEFYLVENEPFGYNFVLKKWYEDTSIFEVYISRNDGYTAIKEDAKCSFFGVDFDMPIYQTRYNLKVPQDKIFIDLVEDYEAAEKLGGIRVTIKRN